MEIRRIEEEAEVRRLSIGVQGHSYDVHPKSGILDPSRKIDDLIEWELEQVNVDELMDPITDAYEIVAGAERVSDSLSVEVVVRYYLQAEPWTMIARDLADHRHIKGLQGVNRGKQILRLMAAVDALIDQWELIGIAHLKEMGQG